jgi:hypothetical protein
MKREGCSFSVAISVDGPSTRSTGVGQLAAERRGDERLHPARRVRVVLLEDRVHEVDVAAIADDAGVACLARRRRVPVRAEMIGGPVEVGDARVHFDDGAGAGLHEFALEVHDEFGAAAGPRRMNRAAPENPG